MATTKAETYSYGIGRRKSATARVRLMSGKGTVVINGKTAEEYFADSKYLLSKLNEPFIAISQENKYAITVVVSGGGHEGQADAIRLGIAKSLVEVNEELRPTLKKADLLGRDSRQKERKKFGLKGARKQRQFTKR